jgi:quercetin dioxygenase-like cupin family protein
MLKRRVFCYLCAALGVAAGTITAAEAQSAGLTRSVVSTIEGPAEGYHTVLVRVEIAPNFLVARHTHPGIESSYVLEGGGVLSVKGREDQTVQAGGAFQIPPETPHSLQNGPAPMRVIGNYIVLKDKPLASPAPE